MPRHHDDAAVLAVHDPHLLAYLAGAWEAWQAAGLEADPGQDRVVPYLFPAPSLFSGFEPATAASITARAGQYAYDTMTLVGPGTWEAARAAVDAALTAADLVLGGERAAYALTRPPGHHATRDCFGGSCYLNNTAAAAARLRDGVAGPVAVIDVDAHHGNGTQAIFYDDAEVLVGSVHVDPGAGWFPHFLGFESETGGGAGAGANRNLPLSPGAGDEAWLAAIAELASVGASGRSESPRRRARRRRGGRRPREPARGQRRGLRAAGRALADLGLPTVLVQEGGYDLDTIGPLVRATLTGFESGS